MTIRQLRARALVAAVLGSLAVAVGGAGADSVGTLQVTGTFRANYKQIDCAAGTPATTSCFREVSVGDWVIPGLGKVTTAYTVIQDGFGSACAHVHAQIPIVVAGKGEIDLAMKTTGCITPDDPGRFPAVEVTVSGGSGLYAGASGSGALDYRNNGVETGHSTVTWRGPLNVAGLAFDTTRPRISGATSKTVKSRAATTRVRYAVSAADATDGRLPASCLPKSGSVFRVGRTPVICTAVDGSGNGTTARFVITVKRVRY